MYIESANHDRYNGYAWASRKDLNNVSMEIATHDTYNWHACASRHELHNMYIETAIMTGSMAMHGHPYTSCTMCT
jgi:hypothetical protein